MAGGRVVVVRETEVRVSEIADCGLPGRVAAVKKGLIAVPKVVSHPLAKTVEWAKRNHGWGEIEFGVCSSRTGFAFVVAAAPFFEPHILGKIGDCFRDDLPNGWKLGSVYYANIRRIRGLSQRLDMDNRIVGEEVNVVRAAAFALISNPILSSSRRTWISYQENILNEVAWNEFLTQAVMDQLDKIGAGRI
jgi:hypothetical protein